MSETIAATYVSRVVRRNGRGTLFTRFKFRVKDHSAILTLDGAIALSIPSVPQGAVQVPVSLENFSTTVEKFEGESGTAEYLKLHPQGGAEVRFDGQRCWFVEDSDPVVANDEAETAAPAPAENL